MNIINKLQLTKGQIRLFAKNNIRCGFYCQTLRTLFRSPDDSVSKTELRFRQYDKLPDTYRIVYKGPMNSYAYASHFAATSSFLGFGVISAWKTLKAMSIGLPLTHFLDEQAAMFSELEIGTFLVGFFALNITLWFVSSCYVLRIYYNGQTKPNRYCCFTIGSVPFTTKKMEFNPGDLKPSSGLASKFPWRDCYFRLGSRRLVLLERHLKTPADLEKMLGTYNVKQQ